MKFYYYSFILFILFFGIAYGQSNNEGELPNWKHLALFQKTAGIHADGFKIKYLRNTKSTWKGWLVPLSIGLGRSNIHSDRIVKADYFDANINTFYLGYTGFKEVRNNLYLNLSLNLSVGSERLIDLGLNRKERFLIGTSPSQSLYFIPDNKYGIVVGLGLYEKLLTSKVYPFDIGIIASVGVKF